MVKRIEKLSKELPFSIKSSLKKQQLRKNYYVNIKVNKAQTKQKNTDINKFKSLKIIKRSNFGIS